MTPDYHYLDKLNPQQRDAVEYLDGPELVIAGAGSGKTRVLTYKILHLLNNGYAPGQIMALTFTNKAAREMKERIRKVAGDRAAARLWMGTFHSVFLRILRKYSSLLGFKSSFSIYDSSDSKNLIKIIIKELGLSDKEYKAQAIATTISNAKNVMMDWAAYRNEYSGRDTKAHRPLVYRIFQIYEERCRIANAMDFDDIIYFMNILLRDNPDVKDALSEQFRYILVDEYQDTNFAQHLIVKQLSRPKNMICVVGDDAQSIYSFRGANIGNIIELEKSYPGLRIFKLERNYRSTQNIVNAAGSLIKMNKHQLYKEVYSENEPGDLITIVQAYSDLEEAAIIASDIAQLNNVTHDSYEDMAILYRTNAQSRVLEEALRKRNIPYRIYGGTIFYQRKEVKDAIAYFRMIVNPDDDESLRRIINYPARGIGETTMKKLQNLANAEKISLWNTILRAQELNLPVNSGTMKKLDAFAEMINLFIKDNEQSDAYSVGQLVINRSGMLAALYHDNSPENISRQENLNELLRGMKEFVDTRLEEGENDLSLNAFLSEVMLASDLDKKDDDNLPKVTLMTAHSAKGLEFKHVRVAGVEEELFPSAMSMDTLEQVEEERRLLYVAITRAKTSCKLSYSRTRFRNGQTVFTSPSRFLAEIDRKYTSVIGTGYEYSNYNITSGNENITDKSDIAVKISNVNNSIYVDRMFLNKEAKKKTNINPTDNTIPYTHKDLKVGMRIRHIKFGTGTILAFDHIGDKEAIRVKFELQGIKNLLLAFSKFTILK